MYLSKGFIMENFIFLSILRYFSYKKCFAFIFPVTNFISPLLYSLPNTIFNSQLIQKTVLVRTLFSELFLSLEMPVLSRSFI